MEKYKYFENQEDYQTYLSSLNLFKIGEGSEGKAYLNKNKEVIKIFDGPLKPKVADDQKDKIVMIQDYDVKSFLLPKQLFILNHLIVGYVSDYFPDNVIMFNVPYNGNIEKINFVNLLKAREKMIEDVKILTKDKIILCDLDFNLLFDNEKLGAIDTFGYHYDKNITLDKNVATIDQALMYELHFHDIGFHLDYNKSLEYNLQRRKK